MDQIMVSFKLMDIGHKLEPVKIKIKNTYSKMALRRVIIAPPSGTTSALVECSGITSGATNFVYLYDDISEYFSFEITITTPVLQPGFLGDGGATIQIPHLAGGYNYNYIIDYGDGTILPVTSYDDINTVHTYLNDGVYEVKISGLCESFFCYYATISSYITKVFNWGNVGLKSINFGECVLLTYIPRDHLGGLSLLTNLDTCFFYCTSLKTIMPGVFGYCSNVTSFYATFQYCSSLKSIPENLFQTCTGVTDFSYVFSDCSLLSFIPTNLFINSSKVVSFERSFNNCSLIPRIPAILFQNSIAVYNFTSTFSNCNSVISIPSGLFNNCPNVLYFGSTFTYLKLITSIPVGLFNYCIIASDFSNTFLGCILLKTIPSGLFDYCLPQTFFYTFSLCMSLTSIPPGLFNLSTQCVNFNSTFYYCSLLESIPSNLFDYCSLVQDFRNTFYNCSALKSIPSNLFDNCISVLYFGNLFSYCVSLTSIPLNLFDYCTNVLDFSNTFSEDISLIADAPELWITHSGANGNNCFTNDTGLNNYYCIPTDWGGLGNECTTTTTTTLYNYLTDWTNVNFDTFDTTGTELTNIIEAAGTDATGVTNTFYLSVVGSGYIFISFSLTLNSGTGIKLYFVKDGIHIGGLYNKLTSGGVFYNESVSTGTWQVVILSYDSGGVDFSASNCKINVILF